MTKWICLLVATFAVFPFSACCCCTIPVPPNSTTGFEDLDEFEGDDTEGEPVSSEVTSDEPSSGETDDPDSGQAGVTKANFDRIQNGMSYDEVVEILGEPTELYHQTERSKMYMWKDDGLTGGNCNVSFRDGKVRLKAESNLR